MFNFSLSLSLSLSLSIECWKILIEKWNRLIPVCDHLPPGSTRPSERVMVRYITHTHTHTYTFLLKCTLWYHVLSNFFSFYAHTHEPADKCQIITIVVLVVVLIVVVVFFFIPFSWTMHCTVNDISCVVSLFMLCILFFVVYTQNSNVGYILHLCVYCLRFYLSEHNNNVEKFVQVVFLRMRISWISINGKYGHFGIKKNRRMLI